MPAEPTDDQDVKLALTRSARHIMGNFFVESKVSFQEALDELLCGVERGTADSLRRVVSGEPQKWFVDRWTRKLVFVGSEIVVPPGYQVVAFSHFDLEETVYAAHTSPFKLPVRWTLFSRLYRETHGTSVFYKGFDLGRRKRSAHIAWVCFANDQKLTFRERAVVAFGLLRLQMLVTSGNEEFFPWRRAENLKEKTFETLAEKFLSNK